MANVGIPAPPQNQDEGAPLMGLYLDRPAWKIPPSGFSACNNVRIEQGRVHSDLMGWSLSTIPKLPGSCIYLTDFIDSFGNRQTIASTPTDLIFCNAGGTNTYVTPTVNTGTAAVAIGSMSVTGVGTRWATDILFGDLAATAGTNAAGTTKFYLTTALNGVPPGLPVSDTTHAGTIQPGTYLLFAGSDTGGPFVVLSQPNIASVAGGDILRFGDFVPIGRANVRPGDQISFGSPSQNSLTAAWYTVASVQSDTALTLASPYLDPGTGIGFVGAYTCRQCLTNTLTGPAPYLPKCFSSNFPAAGGFNNAYPANPTDPIATAGGDAWFFTNGVDPVVVYNNAYTTSALYARSVPFRCAAVRQARGIMIYGGLTIPSATTTLGTSIASSDNGFPLQLAGGVSFQGIAIDGPFQICRVSVLGSSIMLYAAGVFSGSGDNQDDMGGAVVSASFVGFPTIWAFSDVVKTRGPLNGGCVAEFPDRHQFLATDGEYRYNGLFIQVMNDQVWREALKSYDTTRPGAAFAAQNPTHGDLLWAVPLLTDPPGQVGPSTAYVEHYMEQANSYLFKPMTKRDFPFTCVSVHQGTTPTTWASLTGPWSQYVQAWDVFGFAGNAPSVLAGDLSGNIWVLYAANMQAGAPALATCTWASRVIGNARARALVKRVYPEIEFIASPTSSVAVTLTCYDALGGPVTITDTQQFLPSYAGNRFTTHYRRGRMVSVTMSDSAGLGWISDGYDLDWVTGGLR